MKNSAESVMSKFREKEYEYELLCAARHAYSAYKSLCFATDIKPNKNLSVLAIHFLQISKELEELCGEEKE